MSFSHNFLAKLVTFLSNAFVKVLLPSLGIRKLNNFFYEIQLFVRDVRVNKEMLKGLKREVLSSFDKTNSLPFSSFFFLPTHYHSFFGKKLLMIFYEV